MKGKKARTLLLDALCMLAGSAVYAVEVNAFTAPNNIAAGGITGVATMLNYLFDTPIGLVSFLINVPIVLWAVVDIGYKLVAKTVAAIALTSVMIDLFSRFVPAYHGDPILVALFAGLLEGLGLSLIFIRGATTGGSDLVARLLGRRLPHLSMGKLMLAVDGAVVAVSARQMGQRVIGELERTVTYLDSHGGYTKEPGETMLCAVRRFEVYQLQNIIREEDKDAFVIVGEAGQITGEGFRSMHSDDKPVKELLKELRQGGKDKE